MSEFNDENPNENPNENRNGDDSDFVYPKRNSYPQPPSEYIETQFSTSDDPYGEKEYFNNEDIRYVGKKRKNYNSLLVVCIVVLFVVLIGVGGAFLLYLNNENFRNNFPIKQSTNIIPGLQQGEKKTTAPIIQVEEPSESEGNYSAEKVNEIISPSIVAVIVYDFDGDIISEPVSQGSGIIVSEDGYVVTNAHVILNSKKYSPKIMFNSEDEVPAKIIGFDTITDIAVLKVDKTGLTPAKFANSDNVKVGSSALAFGVPIGPYLNFQSSVSRGIVSAVNVTVGNDNNKYIQTDAAINPGNSGGPLVSMDGRVIAINTFKVVQNKCEGLGFGIPSNVIVKIFGSITENGYVRGRAKLGISFRMVNGGIFGGFFNELPNGMMIRGFDENSDLKKYAEIGDIITKIDDKPINTSDILANRIAELKPGDTVTLTIVRINSSRRDKYKEFTATVKLLEDKGDVN